VLLSGILLLEVVVLVFAGYTFVKCCCVGFCEEVVVLVFGESLLLEVVVLVFGERLLCWFLVRAFC
jgi:hypothetical protein